MSGASWVELVIAIVSAAVGWLARHYGVWMPPTNGSSSGSSGAGG